MGVTPIHSYTANWFQIGDIMLFDKILQYTAKYNYQADYLYHIASPIGWYYYLSRHDLNGSLNPPIEAEIVWAWNRFFRWESRSKPVSEVAAGIWQLQLDFFGHFWKFWVNLFWPSEVVIFSRLFPKLSTKKKSFWSCEVSLKRTLIIISVIYLNLAFWWKICVQCC